MLDTSSLENKRKKILEQIKEGVVLLDAGISFLGNDAQLKWNDMQKDQPIIGQACVVIVNIINRPMKRGVLATYIGDGMFRVWSDDRINLCSVLKWFPLPCLPDVDEGGEDQ